MKSMRMLLVISAGLAVALPRLAAQDPDPFVALRQYDGQHRAPVTAVLQQLQAAGQDAARLGDLETKLLAVLGDRSATLFARQQACQFLWVFGSGRAVPALAGLLTDAELSDFALLALTRNQDPAAGQALVAALAAAPARLQVGLLGALGSRREAAATAAVKACLSSPDAGVVAAARRALGGIGTPAAVAALTAVTPRTPAVIDALLLGAERLHATGHQPDALATWTALAAPATPPVQQGAALRALAVAGAPAALDLAVAALRSDQEYVRATAGRLAAVLRDPATTPRYVAAFPDLAVDTQVVVLTALADRGDAAAGPLAVAQLQSPEAGVRAAAVRAAGVLGGVAAVAPLAALAAKGEWADQQLARESLARMKGTTVDEAILKLAREGVAEVRSPLCAVLADRAQVAALPWLLEAALGADRKLAGEAWKAIGRLAPATDHPQLVERLLQVADEGVRDTARGAVVAVSRRVGDRDRVLTPLVAALGPAQPEQKVVLLSMVAAVGGDRALAELVKAAAAPEPAVQRAAVEALADAWEDSQALPALLDIAGQADRPTVLKVIALRGCVRLLSQDERMKPADKVARLAAALAVAPRVEEKRQVLGVVRDCRVPAAVELAAKCLDDEALFDDAADTLLYLAAKQRKGRTDQAAVKGPAMKAALERIAQQATDPKVKERARTLAQQAG